MVYLNHVHWAQLPVNDMMVTYHILLSWGCVIFISKDFLVFPLSETVLVVSVSSSLECLSSYINDRTFSALLSDVDLVNKQGSFLYRN